jgi:NAD(P)-dependent dehydrogenase (short-subunit alcohol dehydrogenase family)
MIHPPHLTLYAIVAATTCGASLVFLVFVSLYSSARVLVHLMHWAQERGEGWQDLQAEKAHRLTTAATSGSISGSSPPQTSRRSGGSAALAGFWSAARRPGVSLLSATAKIIFTGASASLGGKPGFAHFAAAKAGLRTITQSMARKYGPLGIHVAHVVIDGGIDGDRLRNRAPTLIKERGEDGLLGIDAIAETYWHIHRQPRSAWTQEVDLRPFKETF